MAKGKYSVDVDLKKNMKGGGGANYSNTVFLYFIDMSMIISINYRGYYDFIYTNIACVSINIKR